MLQSVNIQMASIQTAHYPPTLAANDPYAEHARIHTRTREWRAKARELHKDKEWRVRKHALATAQRTSLITMNCGGHKEKH